MDQPLVYISLLTWGSALDCINCVRSLAKLRYSNYKLLIRDNASPNNVHEELCRAFPEITVLRSEINLGYATGHWENYKIAKEHGAELFWILNSDLEVDPDALQEMVNVHKQCGDHIYGSVTLSPENRDIVDFGGAAMCNPENPFVYNEWKSKPYQNLLSKHPDFYDVQSVEGSSMLLPIKLIEREGFMKLDFFMYGEETDFCYRLRNRGIRSILVTLSIVYHKNAGATKSHTRLSVIPAYYRRRNFLRFQREQFGLSRWQCLGYMNGVGANLKTLLVAALLNKKNENFFYALACWHAFWGKKGKTVRPEDFVS